MRRYFICRVTDTSVEEAGAEGLMCCFMVYGIASGIVNQRIDYSDKKLLQLMMLFAAGRT